MASIENRSALAVTGADIVCTFPAKLIQRWILIVTTAIAFVAGDGALSAASFVVSNTADSGAGSLRQAIQDANAASGGDIVFSSVTGTIILSSTLPAIGSVITITGPGTNTLRLSGNNAVRILSVNTNGNLTLDGLTLAGGRSFGGNGATGQVAFNFVGRIGGNGTNGLGGAIYNRGIARIVNCTFLTNSATGGNGGIGGDGNHLGGNGGSGGGASGGAIYNLKTVVLSNCTFSGNAVIGGGGALGGAGPVQGPGYGGSGGLAAGAAIYNVAAGTATINNCIFTNNTVRSGASAGDGPFAGYNGAVGRAGASGLGAAIYNLGKIVVLNSVFAVNSVTGGDGGIGGDANNHQGGNGGAGGPGNGGGIYNSGVVGMTNCTFSGNAAIGGTGAVGGTNGVRQGPGFGGSGGVAAGAALYNTARAVASVFDCTFSRNSVKSGNSGAGAPFYGFNGAAGTAGAPALGGAIWNSGTNAILNSTFYANLATGGNGSTGGVASAHYGGTGGAGGNAFGGTVYNTGGLLGVTNCTFANGGTFGGTGGVGGSGALGNGATGAAGSVFGANLASRGGRVNLRNTILAYPTNAANAYGTIIDLGFNLSSSASPLFKTLSSRNNLDPLLSPLANHGGLTDTMDLLGGSPAIDTGTIIGAPAIDQRGVSRPQGATADTGAVEALQIAE